MKEVREFKRRWPVLLALILCVGALGAYIRFPAYAKEKEETVADSSVSMDVTYGYGETAKGDRYLPVRVTLENQENEEFEGTLEILTMESSFEIYRYDYPVSLKKNEKAETIYYVPLGVKSDQLYVTVKDSQGNQVIRKRLKLNTSREVAELMIGVLSDTTDQLQYMDGVGINYGSLRTRLVPMDEKTFPENALGLDLLDVVLITDYDCGRLSHKQQEAIREWVKLGGTLLIGTGNRVDDTLGKFAEELVEVPYGKPVTRSVNFGVEYANKAPGDSFVELPCVEMTVINGTDVMTSDQIPLLSVAVKDSGKVAIAAYDFKDIAQFCQKQPSYVEKIFTTLLGETRIQELAQIDYYGYSNMYYSVLSLINTGSVERLPNLPLYAAVIILYICMVGPGLYYLLKRKRHQDWYFKSVVFMSVCFTVIIYMMGAKTRFQSAFFTYATIEDVSDEHISDLTFINVRTPYNNPYSVDINPDYTIRPITKSYFYDMTTLPKFNGNEDYKVAVQEKKDKTKLQVRDTVAFTPKLFSLSKKTMNTENKGFGGSVNIFDGRISGSVTNNFPYPVENAVLLMYGRVVPLGDLQPGEKKELSDMKMLYYPVSYVYPVARMLSGADQYEKADITDKDYMKAQDQSNLFSFYMYNYMDGYTAQVRVVAFSGDQSEMDFIADGSYVTDGIKMLTSAIDVSTTEGGLIYRTGFLKAPNVISGNYQAEYNLVYGMDPVILEYSLGNDLDVEKVIFDNLSPEFMEDKKNTYMAAFAGKTSFYNYDTGYYDVVDSRKTSFTREELTPYLSPGNNLTVKYVYENEENYQNNIILPMISVIGREK